MIAELRGKLATKSPERIVVDVQGVGYEVLVPLNTFYQLPEVGGEAHLLIHTHVREDTFQLFGFLEPAEKSLFLLLTSVSGIGPRLGLNILSGLPFAELQEALEEGDLARLVAIPGVGKKTAERMILELRDKAAKARTEAGVDRAPAARNIEAEAVSALVNLGYRRGDAERAAKAMASAGASDLEEVIRGALKKLSG